MGSSEKASLRRCHLNNSTGRRQLWKCKERALQAERGASAKALRWKDGGLSCSKIDVLCDWHVLENSTH